MRRALFVCTGNLCRSPMAEYTFQKALADRGIDDMLSESAGCFAMEGNPAASRAVAEMRKHGIDMSRHRTRILTRGMIMEADVVLVMERAHIYTVLALAPEAAEKTILMGHLAENDGDGEIPDPYGGDSAFFSETYQTIRDAAENLADSILKDMRNSNEQ